MARCRKWAWIRGLVGVSWVVLSAAASATPTASPIDPRPLRALLLQTDDAALKEAFSRLEQADERVQQRAFQAFRDTSPEQSARLGQWASSDETASLLRLLRAESAIGAAWRRWGRGHPTSFDAATRAAIDDHAAEAAAHAAASLPGASEAAWVEAHVILLEVARLTGDRDLAAATWARGFERAGSSFLLWSALLDGLERRWGGSYAQLEEAAASANRHAAARPALRDLRARPDADRARDHREAGDPTQALEYHNAALALAPAAWLFAERGWSARYAGDLESALADLDTAIEQDPFVADFHHRRAHVLKELGQIQAADEAAALAVELAPMDDHYAWLRHATAADRRAEKKWHAFVAAPSLKEAAIRGARAALAHPFLSGSAVAAMWLAFAFAWEHLRRLRAAGVEAVHWVDRRLLTRWVLRAYAWLIAVVHAALYADAWRHLGAVDRFIDVPLSGVAVVGGLAFAHGWRVGAVEWWRRIAVVYPLWVSIHWFGVSGVSITDPSLWVFPALQLAPLVGMLFLYAYRRPALWQDDPAADSVPHPVA